MSTKQCPGDVCSRLTKRVELYASFALIALIALIASRAIAPSVFESGTAVITFYVIFLLVVLMFPFWLVCKLTSCRAA